jgi:hypothetical protein
MSSETTPTMPFSFSDFVIAHVPILKHLPHISPKSCHIPQRNIWRNTPPEQLPTYPSTELEPKCGLIFTCFSQIMSCKKEHED